METGLFYFFGSLLLLSAISVVAQRRVFYSAISLILCLFSLAGLYLLLESPFIAAVQVIVYAGAIMALVLFVIMLVDPFSNTVPKDKRRSLSVVAMLLGSAVVFLLSRTLASYGLQQAPARHGKSSGTIAQIGKVLFEDYLLPFEVKESEKKRPIPSAMSIPLFAICVIALVGVFWLGIFPRFFQALAGSSTLFSL